MSKEKEHRPAKATPRPPLPRKGQPNRVKHCRAAAVKHGMYAADTVAAKAYLKALGGALDSITEG